MKQINTYEPGCYYLFESKVCGRNCYFENKNEIHKFEKLWKRYLSSYTEVYRMYISSEGYQVLLRIRTKDTLKRNYSLRCMKSESKVRPEFLKSPWKIVSEQIRIFHSVFAKYINRLRDRQGALVQSKFKRYHFTTKEEFQSYRFKMNRGGEIKGQRNVKYRVGEVWKKGVDWVYFRGEEWGERFGFRRFPDHVIHKLILYTKKLHALHFHPL